MSSPFPRRSVRLVGVLVGALGCAGASCEKKSSGGGDETPPEVESTVPSNGATASVAAILSVTFSEEMDPATVTDNVFRLSSGSTLVPGTVATDSSALTFTFTPTSALDPDASYTAQILADAADEEGNTLDSAYSWSFTTSSGEFVLSSSAFPPSAPIPVTFTCDGVNVSPPLTWTAGPVTTGSYALVFTDLDNGLIHWAIWDIPDTIFSLVQGIQNVTLPNPPGGTTKQVLSYDNNTYGYLGPCPLSVHTYEWVVYAIAPATLPGVTTGSTRTQVETAVLANQIGSASLTGTYAP